MLFDDLQEKLKSIEPDIETITSLWHNAQADSQLQKLEAQASQENFWQHPQRTEISKKLQALKNQHESYKKATEGYAELKELLDLFKDDNEELEKLAPEINKFCRTITKTKVALLLTEPDDSKNCFLSINSGAGGTESQDWAEMLLRMYMRFCERENLTAKLIDYQAGDGAGIKSATLFIKGKNAYGLLKNEHGIHRLVRISPFDSNKRRHTSFAGAFATPEAPDIAIQIDPKDLRIDTYRSGGAGGQHVNKTDSAVRITHIPTNIVVQCQNERSQIQNKETAMKVLKARLYQHEQEKRQQTEKKREKKKIEWGSQIRSYVLHPYKMVKDHRTNLESPQPEIVLDGELMNFIQAHLIHTYKQ